MSAGSRLVIMIGLGPSLSPSLSPSSSCLTGERRPILDVGRVVGAICPAAATAAGLTIVELGDGWVPLITHKAAPHGRRFVSLINDVASGRAHRGIVLERFTNGVGVALESIEAFDLLTRLAFGPAPRTGRRRRLPWCRRGPIQRTIRRRSDELRRSTSRRHRYRHRC